MNLADKVIAALASYEDFEESMETIRKNAYGPVYLVGGKVYRTVSEVIHGINVGARESDWDALVMGDVKHVYWIETVYKGGASFLPYDRGPIERAIPVEDAYGSCAGRGGADGVYVGSDPNLGARRFDRF